MATNIICGLSFVEDACDYWDAGEQKYSTWSQAVLPCSIELTLYHRDGVYHCQSSRNFNNLTLATDPDKETAIRICLRQTREFLTNELATFPA